MRTTLAALAFAVAVDFTGAPPTAAQTNADAQWQSLVAAAKTAADEIAAGKTGREVLDPLDNAQRKLPPDQQRPIDCWGVMVEALAARSRNPDFGIKRARDAASCYREKSLASARAGVPQGQGTGAGTGAAIAASQIPTSGQPSVAERHRISPEKPTQEAGVNPLPAYGISPATGGGSPQRLEAARLLEEARQHSEQNQMQLALTKMNQAIATDPTFADAYGDRAKYYASQKSYDKALQDFEKQVMYSPSDSGAKNNIARTYALKGDFARALKAEDYSLQKHASNPESYMVRGMIFLHFGKAHDAEEDFKYGETIQNGIEASYAGQIQSMRNRPVSPYRPTLAGKTLNDAALQELRENDREAVDILDVVIAQEPRNADAWLLRAKAHYNLKQFALAREDVEQALRLAPDNAEAHRVLGLTLQAWPGQGDAAIAELSKAIELNPRLAMAYINRAALVFKYHPNLQASALRDLDAALEVDPHNPYAWYNRAVYYAADLTNPRVNWDFQIEHYSKAIQYKPDFAGAYGARGVAELGKYSENRDQALGEQGEADLRKALQLKPELLATLQVMVNDLKHVPEANAYLKKMTAELLTPPRSTIRPSSSSEPSLPQCSGGACRAAVAGEYWAAERYQGGVATAEDKARFGDY